MSRVCLTVDFEPDCPPYLSSTFRGIEVGAPALLALFAELGVRATYFTTGEVAARYPDAVRDLVDAGHELGCHGVSHTAFDTLDVLTARREITESARLLRTFAPVTSFRAPYLRFPEPYVRLLEDAEFTLDSSLAKYKWSYRAPRIQTRLTRIPASMTSSVLRPVVLFVHPWEFVDLTREDLRYDCRFRTGDVALSCVREVVALFQKRGDRFVTMRELEPGAAAA